MGGSEEEGAVIECEGKRALVRLKYSSAGGTAVIKHLRFDSKKRSNGRIHIRA